MKHVPRHHKPMFKTRESVWYAMQFSCSRNVLATVNNGVLFANTTQTLLSNHLYQNALRKGGWL